LSYIRSRRPPLLAVWGKNDPFFLPAGAEAFKPRRFARHLFRQIQENRTIDVRRLCSCLTVRGDKVARFNMHTGLFLVWDLAGPSAIDGGDYGFGSRRSHPGPTGQ
jgi:hypothetical protein